MTESNQSIREGTNAQSDDATLEGADAKVNSAAAGVAHAEAEFDAIKKVHDALAPLRAEARRRVVRYITSLLEIYGGGAGASGDGPDEDELGAISSAALSVPNYGTFAGLYAAADPTTNADRALLAGYWLQVCQGGDTFTAHAAQKELTHLGRKLPNITNALTDLKEAKPQLVLQLRKSGKTQQARKTYKVSGAGVKRVEEMIGG
jgi:hypothetical protein